MSVIKYDSGSGLTGSIRLEVPVAARSTECLVTAPVPTRVVGGFSALGGTNPTPVVTGLTTVLAFAVMLNGNVAPGVNTSVLTYDTPVGGTVNVYGWKPTSNANPTLIASTGTDAFAWVAIGW